MSNRILPSFLAAAMLFGLAAGCGDGTGAADPIDGPPGVQTQVGSWFKAEGADESKGQPVHFAAQAFVAVISGAHIATSADGSGIGFSLMFRADQVELAKDYSRILGLAYRTKTNRPGAMTPVSGGLVRFTSIGAVGEPIDGTFSLDTDRPEDVTFPAIKLRVTGSFRLIRKN